MSDVSPYGITQHADAERVTANEMVGERVSPVIGNAQFGSAAAFSTAPYRPPGYRKPAGTGRKRCAGNDNTCKAWPVGDGDLCYFHEKHRKAEEVRRELAGPA